jgi:hypothetical protein
VDDEGLKKNDDEAGRWRIGFTSREGNIKGNTPAYIGFAAVSECSTTPSRDISVLAVSPSSIAKLSPLSQEV